MNPFVELLEKLARAEVRFVLVGGVAVLMQGYARTTEDVDILIEASQENARRLIEVLKGWGEGAGVEVNIDELAVPQTGAIRVIEDFSLDVFTLMRARALGRNLAYADLMVDALACEIPGGLTVLVASIPRLLDLKAGTGRSKDLVDVDTLTEISRGLRTKIPTDLTALELGPTTDVSSAEGDRPSSPNEKP